MKQTKNSMVFYSDWMEILSEFPAELQAKAYVAILRFAFYDELPEDPDVYMLTAAMRHAVARNKEKYTETCRRRAENGRKGGAAGRKSAAAGVAVETPAVVAAENTPAEAAPTPALPVAVVAEEPAPAEEPPAEPLTDVEIAERFVEENPQAVEGFCCQQSISVADFMKLAGEVLSEWRLDAWTPQKIVRGGSQFQGRHLINQIRVKKQKNQLQKTINDGKQTQRDRLSRRRGTETSARSAADYSTTFQPSTLTV